MARTAAEAHKRIDDIEPRVTKLETGVTKLDTLTHVQFKEVFTRIKRLEAILIGTAGTIITMLVMILSRMG